MGAVDESKVPPADKAREAFSPRDGRMERNRGRRRRGVHWPARPAATRTFELFARYGARDFRDIGHKAIYVANSFRTLECHRLAARRARPRSLAYALLKRDKENPPTPTCPDRPGGATPSW
jgi:hypothetical protein